MASITQERRITDSEQEVKTVNPEQQKRSIESQSDLREYAASRTAKIAESSRETIKTGSTKLEAGIRALGGDAATVEAGKKALASVQEKITTETKSAIGKIESLSQGEPQAALADTYSPAELTALRQKTKEEYGGGLVNNKSENLLQDLTTRESTLTTDERQTLDLLVLSQRDPKSLSNDEKNLLSTHKLHLDEVTQEHAYKMLNDKIEKGVVQPGSITSDMLHILKLKENPDIMKATVEHKDQIQDRVNAELAHFTKEGFIKKDEAELISSESKNYAAVYAEAFPNATPAQILEVVRDNARKLAYQTERDKAVFSGSDHGTRHVLEGNMAMADKLLASLGDKVTAKDKVLIHQIIVDHDLGYTVGIAQAKGSFEASKDHPVFSAKFIEENREYYTQKFGEDGYEMIRDGILKHSYPKSEYGTPTDPQKGFNPDIVRSISSTVDALGVTAETKCPAFFREPDVIVVLQKVKLFAETHGGKVDDEQLKAYKAELTALAEKEPDEDRRQGFKNAIDNQFNPRTVDMTIGQYAGVLNKEQGIQVTEHNGKIVPLITMDISQTQALLGDLFGDKLSVQAFVKAMEDFGVDKGKMAAMADTIRKIKAAPTEEERSALTKDLRFVSDKAVFKFSPAFSEQSDKIESTFDALHKISIRRELQKSISSLEVMAKNSESFEKRDSSVISSAIDDLTSSIGKDIDLKELQKLAEIQEKILAAENSDDFKKAVKSLQTVTSKKEKEFMGI